MSSTVVSSRITPRPDGVTEREALLVLEALARIKGRRFGRLAVTISEGRMVDIELVEKAEETFDLADDVVARAIHGA